MKTLQINSCRDCPFSYVVEYANKRSGIGRFCYYGEFSKSGGGLEVGAEYTNKTIPEKCPLKNNDITLTLHP